MKKLLLIFFVLLAGCDVNLDTTAFNLVDEASIKGSAEKLLVYTECWEEEDKYGDTISKCQNYEYKMYATRRGAVVDVELVDPRTNGILSKKVYAANGGTK